MPTDYCTLEEVREFGQFETGDTDNDALIERLITAASLLIDNKVGRAIVPDADETHYFTADDIADFNTDGGIRIGDMILDDTLLSVTTFLNGDTDQTAIASTEYFLMPRAYERKSYIRMKSASTVSFEFDTDGMVEITGRWGYTATIPADVKQAAIEMTQYAFLRRGEALKETDRPQQSMDGTRYLPAAFTLFGKEVIKHYGKKV